MRLALVEAHMRATETVPATAQMTIADAEKVLFNASAARALVAIAKDREGRIS